MKTTTKQTHLYSNTDLRKLLIPIIIEQLLSSLMGTVDTMMVSNVGSAAISAVSLVDSINILVIQALSALAAGGAILCSQYLGSEKRDGAIRSAQQVLFVMTVLSVALSAGCLIFRVPLLRVIFGAVEADVMKNSQVYFLFTLLSFPFIGLYDAGASILRAQNNSRSPMVISVISNFMNIGGNAILIFGFHMGVEGAAISTLISRIFCAVVVLWKLRDESKPIFVKQYLSIRPDFGLIKKILFIGIPSGIENSMFQFGKLAIQSTVSTLGTVAIAAQAMTNILENLNGVAAIGVGIGLMTVVGQCLGAGRKDEAIYYIKKLCWLSEVVIVASCLLVFVLTKPITMIGGMGSRECKALHADDDLYHNCKAALLGHGVCPGIRYAGCRRCKILHDHILLYDVAVPCESLYLPVPRMGIRPDRRLDRHGGRLEPAFHSLYHPV